MAAVGPQAGDERVVEVQAVAAELPQQREP